ncbi:MAG: TIM barrel protein [Anaerolineae bacterium]
MNPRFSVILSLLGKVSDRFSAYGEKRALAELFELASQVKGLEGIELVYPFEFHDVEAVKQQLAAHSLECSAVNVNVKAEPKFHRGSFTSIDPEIRAEAVRYLKTGMDLAASLGCNLVTICPLADGHDYPFEVDYGQAWRWLREGIGEAASYRSDVKVSLEYKRSETRTHCILNSATTALHLCNQIGAPNLGVTIDLGHALYVAETPAQVIALLADADRLALVHVNDNYREFDWDMIPGTVNFWDWLETFLYLDEVGYDGWFTSDVTPARLDPLRVADITSKMVHEAWRFLEKIGPDELRRLIRKGDTLHTLAYVQDQLLAG